MEVDNHLDRDPRIAQAHEYTRMRHTGSEVQRDLVANTSAARMLASQWHAFQKDMPQFQQITLP